MRMAALEQHGILWSQQQSDGSRALQQLSEMKAQVEDHAETLSKVATLEGACTVTMIMIICSREGARAGGASSSFDRREALQGRPTASGGCSSRCHGKLRERLDMRVLPRPRLQTVSQLWPPKVCVLVYMWINDHEFKLWTS